MSLWIGCADSQQTLDAYLKRSYTKDGDLKPSRFMKDFGLQDYDDDFQEAVVRSDGTRSLSELLAGSSYSDQIVPQFETQCGSLLKQTSNAHVLLYNVRYTGTNKAATGGAVSLIFAATAHYVHQSK